MNYKEELEKATNILGEAGYIFHGQNMVAGGTSMFHMIKHLPLTQRIELPVFEDIQMGMATGMALNGEKICTVFPRMDFLILALNQLVNHADKMNVMSNGQFKLKGLIIRTAIGSNYPLMPGPQHCQDYTKALKHMCRHINVIKLETPDQIVPAYEEAMKSDIPTVIIEVPDLYNTDLKEQLIESRAKDIIR